MTVFPEVNPITHNKDAFGAEAETLLEAGLAGEPDFAFCSQYAMPRNGFATGAQRPDYLPRGARVTAGRGDIAVRRNFAPRDAADFLQHAFEHQRVRNFSSIST
jgi:hypothetical protein